jgi:ATP-dependent RNA helicase DHX37/DHR1
LNNIDINIISNDKKIVSPLRLIIMSATMRVEEFTENKFLFNAKIPVINVEAR